MENTFLWLKCETLVRKSSALDKKYAIFVKIELIKVF
jgi:hypothetical protein